MCLDVCYCARVKAKCEAEYEHAGTSSFLVRNPSVVGARHASFSHDGFFERCDKFVRLSCGAYVTCRTDRKGKPDRKAGTQNHRPKELRLHGGGIAEIPEGNSKPFAVTYLPRQANKGTTNEIEAIV